MNPFLRLFKKTERGTYVLKTNLLSHFLVIVRAHSNGAFISFLSPSLRQTVLLKSGRLDMVVLISRQSGLVSVKVRLTMFLGSTYFLMSSCERPEPEMLTREKGSHSNLTQSCQLGRLVSVAL